ncbi:trypsin beta-like [Episyrphus balteatus]|uniref:trypsin beta-like n=1 Tax=Episyrphus balteatus TaxID=286459 RepID=UPI0024855F6B|nr:trypsin beta-like [Episyrphus balteatus]
MFYKFLAILSFVNFAIANSIPVQISNRIIEGNVTTISTAPYQVVLEYKGQTICGGSLITPTCVLTAAHCFNVMFPYKISIRGGMSKLSDKSINQQMKQIYKHENFNEITYDNDIAFIKLSGQLLGKNIKTIKLSNSTVKVGQEVRVTGFGYTEEDALDVSDLLREVKVNVVSSEECHKAYEGQNNITEAMMCAKGKGNRKDACTGDSGGPVVVNNTLVGVVSYGIGCGRPEYPGVYAKVKFLRPFIDRIVSKYC